MKTPWNHLSEVIVDTIRESLLLLDADFRILEANRRFHETFRFAPEETLGRLLYDLGNRQWDAPGFRTLLEEILPRTYTVDGYILENVFSGTGFKTIMVNACRIVHPEIPAPRILLAILDITEQRHMEAMVQEAVLRDPLTDLYNRPGFIAFAEQQFRTAKRTKRQMMLAFIDIDDMKAINDTLGHALGDRALIDTAGLLRQTFRTSDIIGRIGGDEFAVLSIETTDLSPRVIGARLKHHLDVYNLQQDRQRQLSLSVGMALYIPEHPVSLIDLMAQADTLMHVKKGMRKRQPLTP